MRERIQDFRRRGAEVIAIAPDNSENALRYFRKNELPFLCLADPNRTVFALYGVKSGIASLGQRPGLFIIGAGRVVLHAHIGSQQWDIPSIDDTLRWLDEAIGTVRPT